jgi:hypothetical protein
MARTTKVPVTMRALTQRINRTLSGNDKTLKATRETGRARMDLGEFYIVDGRRGLVTEKYVDPEALGRELGVLADYEEVRD